MSYANPFNATLIPGTTQAKLIDDTFRTMHAALIERLNDKVVEDATADPWVLKPEVSGLKNGKTLVIPFNHFLTTGGGSTTIHEDHVGTNSAAGIIIAGFSLPGGVTIREAAVFLSVSGTTSIELYKVTGAPPFTKVSIAAWGALPVGQEVRPNGTTLNHVVDPFHSYYISLDMTSFGSMGIYGAYILYDTPSHLNTL